MKLLKIYMLKENFILNLMIIKQIIQFTVKELKL